MYVLAKDKVIISLVYRPMDFVSLELGHTSFLKTHCMSMSSSAKVGFRG
jgi:hypothetical protein